MPELPDRIQGAVYGSFIADALSLAAHWIYNPRKIERTYQRVTDYLDPSKNQYHGKRVAGDQSHYGDQALVLMRSLESGQGFSLSAFADRWREMWAHYDGYVDGATRETLANLEAGSPPDSSGSSSNDIAGASRMAPLLAALPMDSEEPLLAAARAQASLTHGDPQVDDATAFFARTIFLLLQGEPLDAALDTAASAAYSSLDPAATLAQLRQELDRETTPALAEFGLTCHSPDAFPATLFLILKFAEDPETALIENVMAGGDSAARGMLVGMVLGAAHGLSAFPERWINDLRASPEIRAWLASHSNQCEIESPAPGTNKVEFTNDEGHTLAARLEWPPEGTETKAVAIFAHCFTCSKDLPATTRIARALAGRGFAVLRFDFTGLGSSDGDFANTNFSSNVEDLVAAARHLEQTVGAPTLLIGHSLGGAAVIAAADQIDGIRGIVTIGTPSDPAHVAHLLGERTGEVEAEGQAEIEIGGRPFTIKRHFLDDIRSQNVLAILKRYRGSLLILHSPRDQTVDVNHAAEIFMAAKHPKSFVSLAEADHLLSRPSDSAFAAEMIAAWANHLFFD